MNQKQSKFAELPLINKIEHVVDYSKKYLIKNHKLKDTFFVFDSNERIYMIPIDNRKFLDIYEYRKLFNKVAISVIEELEAKYNIKIINSLYIYKRIFDTTVTEEVDLDIEWEEDELRKDAMIVLQESKFNVDINVYGCIETTVDSDKYTLLSEKPIQKINLSKLDNDHSIKGFLTNIIT